MKYTRYFRKILAQPPWLTWQQVRRRVTNYARHNVDRLRVRWRGADLSEAQFKRALQLQWAALPDFLAHMAARRAPRFFIGSAGRPERMTALRTTCPDIEAVTIAAADRICDHIFDLLGSGPMPLGESIPWQADFKTGYCWSATTYHADIRYTPPPGGHDIKVPWELSRCQHFVWLGQAYWFTNDEKYAGEFMAQVQHWLSHNPPRQGVNWVCPMDIAIRVINWLWGYYFFQDSPCMADTFRLAFFKSLLLHGRHIFTNLEYSETLTSNHYLSDIVGLVYLGLLLPELTEAAGWRDFALQELEREMFKQVYPDGVDFEASTAYHRLVTELFMSATLLARLNGHTFSPAYMQRLERMVEFVLYLTKPDGTVPLFGDNDNGRLHRLQVWANPGREWHDHRYLLAVGAVLFDRDDFAHAAGDQWAEAIWLLGPGVLALRPPTCASQPELTSHGYPDAGVYLLRQQDLYLAVDAGPNGQNGNGGHAHNDLFSFELHACGKAWFIDPGTHVYTADYASRNRLRATAAHNTVMVDNQEQNRFDETILFQMENDACPKVIHWRTAPSYDLLVVEHYGYARLPSPVVHRRTFVFNKTAASWWLQDDLQTDGQHTYTWHFHLDPAVQPELDDANCLLRQDEHALLLRRLSAGIIPTADLLTAAGALGYGQHRPHPVLRFTYTHTGSLSLAWLLYPLPQAGSPPSDGQGRAIHDWATRLVRTEIEGLAQGVIV